MKGTNLKKYFFAGLFVLVIDFISKLWVHLSIPLASRSLPFYPYGGIPVLKNFLGVELSIIHEINRGAAWGAFADFQYYLMALRVLLVISLVFYILFYNKQKSMDLPLVLIAAGAIGNIVDFFIYGHVIDMIHFKFGSYDYPIFNIADSSIFLGVALLVFLTLFSKKKARVT